MEISTSSGGVVGVSGGLMSFLAANGRTGWRNIGFMVSTPRGAESLAAVRVTEADGGLRLRGSYMRAGLREEVALSPAAACALVITRRLTNAGNTSVTLHAAWAGRLPGGDGRPVFADNSVWRARFWHLDNLRTERYPWCRPEAPLVRTLPTASAWFGDQESQAAPCILFTNDRYTETLVEGQLGQERTRMRWRLAAAHDNELFADYAVDWQFHTGGVVLQPGEALDLEPLYYEILAATHPQDALDGYFREVTARNRLAQEGNILHRRAFYCSWNYGIMQDISEDSLLRTARCIRKELPGIRHFLIDGGWQSQEAVATPDCSNFYLPEAERCHRARFPNGMKAMADKLRALGLAPALWWTPSVNLASKLARENPGWLAKDADGAPYRLGNSGYLDYSLPPVQEYFNHIFTVIFREWGYEAMKMDFWSQSVESSRIRFHTGTGVQWRDWLLGTIRGYLPADGFLMTCVATAMGNPFLGKSAHTYRNCIDVGHYGHWGEHVYASCWVQGVLAFPGRRIGLLNVDGLGVSGRVSDAENLHRLTYGFITMGSLEIDGRIEELKPRHVEWLRRLTTDIDRGYPVRTLDEEAFTGAPFARVLMVDYPDDSPTRRRGVRKHLALLNWHERPRMVGVTLEQLGLKGPVNAREFWTDEQIPIGPPGLALCLPGHGAKLLEIR